ncbi:hypothetical protein [Martelella sp. HB161492]|uniref:hypothetical protein n=1 Tax=Martelella sp. HB161492 TaxID=2720726 RepID=UPI001591B510|nr:hypothetical protein [Martelella sp. HB161492]
MMNQPYGALTVDTTLMRPEVLARITGISKPHILSALAASRLLHDELAACINSRLPPLPRNIPLAQQRNYELFSQLSAAQFHLIARRITLLINRQAILMTTAGQQLKMLSEWVGDEAFLRRVIRSHTVPLATVSPLSNLDNDLLDSFNELVLGLLLGLLHPAHRARFVMMLGEDKLPEAEILHDGDMANFLEILRQAWPTAEQTDEEEDDDGSSQS